MNKKKDIKVQVVKTKSNHVYNQLKKKKQGKYNQYPNLCFLRITIFQLSDQF